MTCEMKTAKNFSSRTKEDVFFSAASCKKDTIFDAARNFFDPSYFVTALEKVDFGVLKLVVGFVKQKISLECLLMYLILFCLFCFRFGQNCRLVLEKCVEKRKTKLKF
jgi:hypothetical protein